MIGARYRGELVYVHAAKKVSSRVALILTESADPPSEVADDAALLRGFVAGEPRARRQVVERLAPVIRGRLRRALVNWPGQNIGANDLDDLTNLVWCRLLENGASRLLAYDPAVCSLEGYVSMITVQMMLNVVEQHRTAKRKASGGRPLQVDALEDLPTHNAGAAREEARHDLHVLWAHLIEQLSDRGRAILHLVYADGCDADTAARTLGVSKQVIYNWQFKIRELARSFFDGAP